jgi:SNF2 family DNA or RNA helicase
MLFGQPQSVAHGLNLQATARIVVWMTLTWSLEDYEQFIQRIWRQGQKRHVHVYRIVARGTIDEAVIEALDIKDKQQQRLLQALEKRYGERKKTEAATPGKNSRRTKVSVRKKESWLAA